jgi:hypothetical protein
MSRIPSENLAFQPQREVQANEGELPGHPIGGEPTVFGSIPVPIPIIPFGGTVDELIAHHEVAPTITTTTTTTTTSARNFERIGPTPIRTRLTRGLSAHRMRKPLASSEETARSKEQRSVSGSESASSSDDEARTTIDRANSLVFRKVTLKSTGRQKSESRLAAQRAKSQLAKTGETPRPKRAEPRPAPMVSSAPDALATDRDPDLPRDWRKAWARDARKLVAEPWCKTALSMIDRERATVPDLEAVLNTRVLKRAAYEDKLTVAEAASIFLYTTALYKEINEPLREGRVQKLPADRRKAVRTMIKGIDHGLEKLPPVTDPLVRVVKLADDFGDKLQPGKQWKQKSYGSCFRAADRSMSWDGNYELFFATSGAHDVSAYSDAKKESEVLVERGRRYRIADRNDKGDTVKLALRETGPTNKH